MGVLLCFSMHLIDIRDLWETIFGLYFLVPFGLVVAVLLLEMGLVSAHRGVQGIALALPAGLVFLAAISHRSDRIYEEFLGIFTERLGASPAYLALVAAACFYAYAALRRVPHALDVATAALMVLAVAGVGDIDLDGFFPFGRHRCWRPPCCNWEWGVGGMTARCLTGCLAGVASLILPADAATTPLRMLIAFQLVLLTLLILGAGFDDDLGRTMGFVGTGLGAPRLPGGDVHDDLRAGRLAAVDCSSVSWEYRSSLPATACCCGTIPRWPSAGWPLACWLAASSWQIYVWCRQAHPRPGLPSC